MSPVVLGISAYFHDAACCVLREGRLAAAAQEERFSRIKHDPALPVSAARFCLESAGLTMADVDCVAYYEQPALKLERQLWSILSDPKGAASRPLPRMDPARPEREIRDVLGYAGPIFHSDHHRSHAASAYFYSGFPDAAVLTADGVGEWATTGYGFGKGASLSVFETVDFPDSLGLLYSTITGYLGFEVNEGEYKVMGLASYGEPTMREAVLRLVSSGPGGGFRLDQAYFDFNRTDRMHSERLPELLGQPARLPGGPITGFHRDLARSLQDVLEQILLEKARHLHSVAPSQNLCMAGGVALNCVANGRILREGPFRRMFVQPASGDAGCALGAAVAAYAELTGRRPEQGALRHVFLGPSFAEAQVRPLVANVPGARDFTGDLPGLLGAVVDRLEAGAIVGWFHGAMEFGPRSLGARSILADPRRPEMKDRVNSLIKKREEFRPFAPAVLAADAAEHFELDHPSPFMLETCAVRSPLPLPAITHVDGSVRVQTVDEQANPRFHALLTAFKERTGCPILLNTSFNMAGEPIVCSPADAAGCFVRSGLDSLVLEDFVIDAADVPANFREYFEGPPFTGGGISRSVYTLF
jgi:carbamoyltransferase